MSSKEKWEIENPLQETLDEVPLKLATRNDFEAYVRAAIDRDKYMYKNAKPLNYGEFLQSAFSDEARERTGSTVKAAAARAVNARATLNETAFRGSGYREYAKEEAKRAYEETVADAAKTLADAYPAYYEDLPESMRSTPERRLRAISFIISHSLTNDEAIVYGLAAGLSYAEALEIAEGSGRLRDMIGSRFEYYQQYLGGGDDGEDEDGDEDEVEDDER